METKIIISATSEETRMGLTENGRLMEYLVERSSEKHLVGNIFKGRVNNVVPGIQAAFIDIGLQQNAFLYLGESNDITEGKSILVQITKDARGSKGPSATRELTLPGRYVVLLPLADYIGVSHKIENKEERNRLKAIIEEAKPDGMGIVIRTAAIGASEEALLEDIRHLCANWRVIEARGKVEKAPATLYRELDLSVRIVRDYLTNDVSQIILHDKAVYGRVCELLKNMPGGTTGRVLLHEKQEDVFAYYGLREEIDTISDRRIDLSCGGYLVIDYTEAMTVIDVNSGRYSGRENLEETIMQINREAAVEIARQLRLRDIGGIIVVDFIDMHTQEHQQEILQVLQQALSNDKMKPRVQDITVLNLVEITRKKARQNLSTVLYAPCPICQGGGRVQSRETVALEIKRRLRTLLAKPCASRSILISANPWMVEWLRAKDLRQWERELACKIKVEADTGLHIETFSILDNTGVDK